ncbi:helix-turn-helix domain-containing protein [Rhodobacter capsulatus]
MTFIAYVKERRMSRAKDLLAGSSLPILNVALDLAYQDANYFCKAFKKEVGVSPSEFRRASRP